MRKGWVKWALGTVGVMAALVGLAAGRWTLLLRNGRRLVASASTLPRSYEVGEGRPLRMVVLGDSTGVGVGAGSLEATMAYRVASALKGRASVTNLAVSGARLADVVRDQLPKMSPGTEFAFVSISANDATHGTPLPRFGDDLKRLLDGLKAVRRVVLTTTPNFRTTPALPWLLNRRFARRAFRLTEAIHEASARYPNVRLADLNRQGSLTTAQYASDGFHPNAEGYAIWAKIIVRATE